MKFINKIAAKGLRRDIPCNNHRFAAPDWETPEVMGMQKHGVRFEECSKCKWIKLMRNQEDITDEVISSYHEREACLE